MRVYGYGLTGRDDAVEVVGGGKVLHLAAAGLFARLYDWKVRDEAEDERKNGCEDGTG